MAFDVDKEVCIIKKCRTTPRLYLVHHCGLDPDKCNAEDNWKPDDEKHHAFWCCEKHHDQLANGEIDSKSYRKSN